MPGTCVVSFFVISLQPYLLVVYLCVNLQYDFILSCNNFTAMSINISWYLIENANQYPAQLKKGFSFKIAL